MSESRSTRYRRWLQEQVGYQEAGRRINLEARLLKVDPLSDAAIWHAIATYTAETGKHPRRDPAPWERPVRLQDELLEQEPQT